MHLRWHYLEDNRGEKLKPCTIRQASKSSGLHRSEFVGKNDAGRFWSSLIVFGASYTVAMQIVFLIFGVYHTGNLFTPIWFKSIAYMFFGFGVPMALFIKWAGWNNAECAKRCVLSIRHCPSCAYCILDINPETDGCTVCPECGSAWNLSESE
jgi:hypothetical protein